MPYKYNKIESDNPMAEEAYAMPEISDVFYDGNLQEAIAVERATVLEIELENDSNPFAKEAAEPPERTKLKRELEREALTRLEEAARTQDDFQNVTSIWNRLDSNRERKERYHEIGRSDIPLDWGASMNEIIIPAPIPHIFWQQIMKGEFLDVIYNCPFEMHELVSDIDISTAIYSLKEEHKEILFYLFIRQYSCQKIAGIKGHTDRNIRKVRDTALKKLRKQFLSALQTRNDLGYQLTFQEREFLSVMKVLLEI